MKKIIDLDLLNKFEESLSKDKISKISNILNKTSILYASYNSKKYNSLKNHFEIDLIGLPVENQQQSGRCWIFAATNMIREQIAKKLNLEDFSISNSYLAFWDKIERSNFFLESIIKNINQNPNEQLMQYLLDVGIEDGGQWDMVVNLVEKYGIVPNNVMQDHYHAGNSKIINYLLNWKLRDFACELKKSENKSIENLHLMKERMLKDIFKILEIFYGTPPKYFDFEYTQEFKENSGYSNSYNDLSRKHFIDKNITPKEFYNKYVDTKLSEYVSIIHAPQKTKDFFCTYSFEYLNNVIEGKKILHVNLEYELFAFLILNQLKNKQTVWFGSDVRWYFDKNNGIWDDEIFDLENLFSTQFSISKGDMLSYKISCMTHAMLLVGSNFNKSKLDEIYEKIENSLSYEHFKTEFHNLNIDRWKIENSWGSHLGDWGYFIMSESWFNKYVFQAVVLKKDLENLLNRFNLPKVENQKNIILDPWDPIGTLAK